jgi:predicted nucleic acid-binding protein
MHDSPESSDEAKVARPSVYLETTVIGHLVGRMHSDPVVAGRQVLTREWWVIAKERYRLLISEVVLQECKAGDPDAARERLEALEGIELIPNSLEADSLAQLLTRRGAIPPSEPRDAFHVSLAAVGGVQFLLTWNFRHIANASTHDLIEATCREAGFEPPRICTPDQLSGP